MNNLVVNAKEPGSRIELLEDMVYVAALEVPLTEALEYLRQLPAEKRELAFVHAVRIGMAEILARRRRFNGLRRSPVTLDASPCNPNGALPAPDDVRQGVAGGASPDPLPARRESCKWPTRRFEPPVGTPATDGRSPCSGPASRGEQSVSDDLGLQGRVNQQVDPTPQPTARRSARKPAEVVATQEPDRWLRRLDQALELLEKRQAIGGSKTTS